MPVGILSRSMATTSKSKPSKEGIAGPTSVALAGKTLWIAEGQLPHLLESAKSVPPRLPFRIIGVPLKAAKE
jgi:hypothetical protein